MHGGHHHHHHGHDHHGHAPARGDRRWLIAIVLNGAFVAVEAAAGVIGRSSALLADAGHNLSDVLSLVLAGGAAWLASRPAEAHRTYGFGKATVLAALANAVALVFVCGLIAREALTRLTAETEPSTTVMMSVAAAGVVINGLTAMLFLRGRNDANVRGAFLHMTADAAISAGVVVAGALIMITGQGWIDPAASLGIVVLILWGTWGLLKDAFNLAVDAAPPGVDVGAIRAFLAGCPGVSEVHDLHVWPLSTTETALTAHLVVPGGGGDGFLIETANVLRARFGIAHATLQVEASSLAACEDLHE